MCIYICLNWLKIKEKNDAKICSEILVAVIFRIFSGVICIYIYIHSGCLKKTLFRDFLAKQLHKTG